VLPQVLLSGLFGPRETMTPWLRHVSDVLPLTYAVDAMQRVRATPDLTTTSGATLSILAASCTLALLAGAATLRRRTA
jgi:ABC-2 type transport system permease protein